MLSHLLVVFPSFIYLPYLPCACYFPLLALAYNEGLKIDPNNAACKDGMGEILKATQQPGGGDPMGGMATMFKDIVGKVASNPSLKHHLNDSAFMEKLVAIEKDPNLLQTYMSDQRIMQGVYASMISCCFGLLPS
jgi:hypothetical protein